MIKDWKNKTYIMKILTIFGLIISVSVVILAILQIIGVWENSIYVFSPLIGVLMIIQTIENWKKNKGLAYFSLFTALFLFTVTFITIFIKLQR